MKIDRKQIAVSVLASIAGAYLWKQHRVWGFLLGGLIAGEVYTLVAPTPTTNDTTSSLFPARDAQADTSLADMQTCLDRGIIPYPGCAGDAR